MKKRDDFLIEVHTEELPPKALRGLGEAFRQQINERLQKAGLSFEGSQFYASPRRLAVWVQGLAAVQADQVIERKGPAFSAAFDESGQPSAACIGFARSCGVAPEALSRIKNNQGEWVAFIQQVAGKSAIELLPAIVEQSVAALPVPKRMRWGSHETQFVRPVHSVIMLFGDKVVETQLFEHPTGRTTQGHRFLAPNVVLIQHAAQYAPALREAFVIADFADRRNEIASAIKTHVGPAIDFKAHALIDPVLLDEVTGLVEWPTVLIGHFDRTFLNLPPEVLICTMQDHQRYFPVVDAQNQLLPHFVIVSNIRSKRPTRVVHGNERVLRARLSDAAFFYESDKKESLEQRIERLRGIIFQAKLGTLYDKAERLSKLTAFIAQKMQVDEGPAAKAAWLAKTDLTTQMVNEFPELQGTMGYYYACHEGLPQEIALAIKEHYLPRFAGDQLPKGPISQALAIADRLDSLIGAFGIHQTPTGDKDPYGLRRAALGVVRILIENKISLDLQVVCEAAFGNYAIKLENTETVPQVLSFIQDRLRAWYQEQGVMADVFAAVAALKVPDPSDMDARIKAVQAFKQLNEAETLSIANKRVSNILSKYENQINAKNIDPAFFENLAERELARQLEEKSNIVSKLSGAKKYDEVLLHLAGLRKPVDDFFDQVLVMTDDKERRENRILLLTKLRSLFLQVADIALLQ